jgi:sortase A
MKNKRIGWGFILFGLILLVTIPLSDYRLGRLSEAIILNGEAEATQSSAIEAVYDFDEVEELSASLLMPLPKIETLKGIGEIKIPDVNMHLPILSGLSNDNLKAGAGTMKSHQEIGKGNYALAGHNWRDKTTLFSPLHRVERGMHITVREGTEEAVYVIDLIDTVDPSRIDVIQDKDEPMLTLVTCNHDGTERLIVQASLVQ